MRKVSMLAMLGAVIAAGTFGSVAKADSIEIASATAASLGGGVWQYTYTLQLTSPNQIDDGVGFTDTRGSVIVFYDVLGLINGSVVEGLANNWSLTIEGFTGGIPASNGTGNPAVDNAGISNLRFNYVDTLDIVNPGPVAVPLGTVSFQSTFAPGPQSLTMIARDRTIDPLNANAPGSTKFNSDLAIGPVVPLPAAAWAGLSMLGGLGFFGAVRRRRMA